MSEPSADRPEAPAPGPDRRRALIWAGVVAATLGAGGAGLMLQHLGVRDGGASAAGYGRDPNVLEPPRQPWPRILTARQRTILIALMDTVLPGDAKRPAPSALGLIEFFEEWLSAPYPNQVADLKLLRPLIRRLDALGFARLDAEAKVKTLKRIEAEDKSREAFSRFVCLTAGAYYTTPEGAALMGFIGNQPREHFAGPPQAVIDQLLAAAARL